MDTLYGQKGICMLIFIFVYSIVIYFCVTKSFLMFLQPISVQSGTKLSLLTGKETERILTIYVWANLDQQSVGNLEYFIRHGVNASQPVDYYFILQQVNNKTVNESLLPQLPPNARYIQHENKCYDIGTFGWFLSQNITNTTLYKYFIFMNSSVRGPFLVPYFEDIGIWWYEIFTRRLTDKIKLIGPSISCQQRPHVQSYLMVTDQVGFSLLTSKTSNIFRCHANYRNAVFDGEIAASQLLLRANYQIASLQSKYLGWDFRKPENQACNGKRSAIHTDGAIDQISHDPFELIFVKYKGVPPFDTSLKRRALVYQKWFNERQRSQ